MPRVCTICRHPDRAAIDAALVEGATGYRDIGRRSNVGKDALGRHRAQHLPKAIVRAKEAVDVGHAIDIVQQLQLVNATALGILQDAYLRTGGDTRRKDPATALKALAEVRRQIELQARLLGELKDGPQVSVGVVLSPEWVSVRAVLMAALAPFPEARAAVAEQLSVAEAAAHAHHRG